MELVSEVAKARAKAEKSETNKSENQREQAQRVTLLWKQAQMGKPQRPTKTKSKRKQQAEKREAELQTCFNCGEVGHLIKNCPEPVNKFQIAENAKKLLPAVEQERDFTSPAPPPLASNASKGLIDTGCNMTARVLQAKLQSVISRATRSNICALVSHSVCLGTAPRYITPCSCTQCFCAR
jgi:hypothetical protein